jgi:hypothetical protein
VNMECLVRADLWRALLDGARDSAWRSAAPWGCAIEAVPARVVHPRFNDSRPCLVRGLDAVQPGEAQVRQERSGT